MHRSQFIFITIIYSLLFSFKIFAINPNIVKSINSIDFSQITYIAPASGLSESQWNKINEILKIPKIINGKAIHNNSIFYHAADDKTRFYNLLNALNGEAKYLWCIRGGYGSARLLDDLSSIKKPVKSKILIGYSDITFLHLLFNKWGWKTIHGAMPYDLINIKINPKNFSLLAKILSNPKGTLSYTELKAMNNVAKNSTAIKGEILGGNLTLLENSLGTSWEIDGKNKIIFIEDIGCPEYCIDRSLLHMKQAGIFLEAKAIIFGQFILPNRSVNLNYAIQRFANEINIPVFSSQNFGHGNDNYPIIFGATSIISSKASKPNFTLDINYDFDHDMK